MKLGTVQIINGLIVVGFESFPLALMLTFVFATVSWVIIEKPALRLKRYSLLKEKLS